MNSLSKVFFPLHFYLLLSPSGTAFVLASLLCVSLSLFDSLRRSETRYTLKRALYSPSTNEEIQELPRILLADRRRASRSHSLPLPLR